MFYSSRETGASPSNNSGNVSHVDGLSGGWLLYTYFKQTYWITYSLRYNHTAAKNVNTCIVYCNR